MNKWLALLVLCCGVLMIVLDTTVVNVALPSIQSDLGFTAASLAWVVNAYMLTFGGFLLLGGRLGDLYGHRKLFLLGLTLFTLASAACGFAGTQTFLIVARAVQGFGGAIVSAVSLSLVMNLFTEKTERAKAMGIYGFVTSAGGSIGVLLGGFLTNSFNWHWIFLINVPLGLAVTFASLHLVPKQHGEKASGKLDIFGAITITSAMLLAVYAIVNGNEVGLAGALVLLLAFLEIEVRVTHPLMPLRMFRLRNVTTANIISVLWAAAMFAWFFLSAQYLQMILGYSPLQVGLSFLPTNLIMAAFSLGLSAKMVLKFGIKKPLALGLLLVAAGLFLFARAPVDGQFVTDVLPSMILLGLGAGMAFNPLLLNAMNDVAPSESGLASGMVNTSFMMGGSLGLAVLASIAAAQMGALAMIGVTDLTAILSGYHLAFLAGTCFALLASLLAALVLRSKKTV
jgi:EmrB/QacA subfamily drug resistance transporter